MSDELVCSCIGAAGVRSGRGYTKTEIAALRRCGLLTGVAARDLLTGPPYWATGPYWPDAVRKQANDWAIASAAMDREWAAHPHPTVEEADE